MRYLRSAVFAAIASASVVGACAATSPEGTEAVDTAGAAITENGVSATLAVTSDWGAGYCASVTLTNGSTAAVTTWQLVFFHRWFHRVPALERYGHDER
jgi:cellulase/cellobiase CelA1